MIKVRITPSAGAWIAWNPDDPKSMQSFAVGRTPPEAFVWLKRYVLACCAIRNLKPPRWALGDAVV